MSVETPVQPDTETPTQDETLAVDFKSSHRRNVLAWRDLVTPALVALVLVGLYVDISRRDLDTIESNVLNRESLTDATLQHIYVSVSIAVLVMLVAVPAGILVTRRRTRRLAPAVLAVANVGQAAPSLGLLALVGIYAIGFWPVVLILTAYSALSVLRNTIVGLEGVDRGVLDAARGMGMSAAAVLMRVELPLAVPVIGAGARTALVLAVGTVPLGYALDAGGLGLPLFGAIKTNRPVVTFTIAVMIAALALLMDWAAGILQRAATPKGIR
ncbi:MAG: ABC transporter permease [Nocardioidaceae bacterium]|nr:ABC transporter permease [Nocardioidaceae bacterium]NUS50511.1 ABC transporter permease [Nocardioidaceae bacterium]